MKPYNLLFWICLTELLQINQSYRCISVLKFENTQNLFIFTYFETLID